MATSAAGAARARGGGRRGRRLGLVRLGLARLGLVRLGLNALLLGGRLLRRRGGGGLLLRRRLPGGGLPGRGLPGCGLPCGGLLARLRRGFGRQRLCGLLFRGGRRLPSRGRLRLRLRRGNFGLLRLLQDFRRLARPRHGDERGLVRPLDDDRNPVAVDAVAFASGSGGAQGEIVAARIERLVEHQRPFAALVGPGARNHVVAEQELDKGPCRRAAGGHDLTGRLDANDVEGRSDRFARRRRRFGRFGRLLGGRLDRSLVLLAGVLPLADPGPGRLLVRVIEPDAAETRQNQYHDDSEEDFKLVSHLTRLSAGGRRFSRPGVPLFRPFLPLGDAIHAAIARKLFIPHLYCAEPKDKSAPA